MSLMGCILLVCTGLDIPKHDEPAYPYASDADSYDDGKYNICYPWSYISGNLYVYHIQDSKYHRNHVDKHWSDAQVSDRYRLTSIWRYLLFGDTSFSSFGVTVNFTHLIHYTFYHTEQFTDAFHALAAPRLFHAPRGTTPAESRQFWSSMLTYSLFCKPNRDHPVYWLSQWVEELLCNHVTVNDPCKRVSRRPFIG